MPKTGGHTILEKPENYTESYQSGGGNIIIIKDMTDKSLSSVYYYLLEQSRIIKRNLKNGTVIKSGKRPNIREIIIFPIKESAEKIITEYSIILGSLKYEIAQRKALAKKNDKNG